MFITSILPVNRYRIASDVTGQVSRITLSDFKYFATLELFALFVAWRYFICRFCKLLIEQRTWILGQGTLALGRAEPVTYFEDYEWWPLTLPWYLVPHLLWALGDQNSYVIKLKVINLPEQWCWERLSLTKESKAMTDFFYKRKTFRIPGKSRRLGSDRFWRTKHELNSRLPKSWRWEGVYLTRHVCCAVRRHKKNLPTFKLFSRLFPRGNVVCGFCNVFVIINRNAICKLAWISERDTPALDKAVRNSDQSCVRKSYSLHH